MQKLLGHSPRGPRIGLAVFVGFTVVALLGYGTFGRHPELLAAFPALASFYGTAFKLFAQAHVIVGALVLFYYLARHSRLAWLPSLALVYATALASELLGTSSGLPFGSYSYSGLLGWKWFELVPALIPLSWFMMALPAFVMARRRFPNRMVPRLLLGAALLTAWDLALDPAMSGVTNYWTWGEAGPYYGMPLVNLAGWLLTGFILMLLINALSKPGWLDRLSVHWMAIYYGVTIAMPLGMLLLAGLWMGVAVGLLVPALLVTFSLSGALEKRRADRNRNQVSTDSSVEGRPVVADRHDALAFVRARADEAGDTTAPLKFFKTHSRSFSFAAWWFDDEQRRLIAGLYALCRTTDDFADRGGTSPEVMTVRLDTWQELVEQAYLFGDTGIPWLDAVMSASAERGVPIDLARDLIDGVRMDLALVRIQTWEHLDVYMYRVASVVGIWMCHLFGVHDAASHRRAAALGKAMQLTNILRDVGEDLDEDRIYLPKEALERYEITEDGLRAMRRGLTSGRAVPPAYVALMHEMIGRAEALYEYAHPGLAALPLPFRRAAAVASEVYRGVHRELRLNGYDNLQRRAVTSLARKIALAGRALVRLSGQRAQELSADPEPRKTARTLVAYTATLLLFALSSPAMQALAACPPLADVRSDYLESVEAQHLIEPTRRAIADCSGPVYRAYDAALLILKGKHAVWPPSKLKYVRQGLAGLDEVVRDQPPDVEVRYLRLLSCYYLPGLFGRTWSVQDDFDVLASLLPAARDQFPAGLYSSMIRFVLNQGEPTPERRDALLAAFRRSGESGDS